MDLLLTKYLRAGISYEGIQPAGNFPGARAGGTKAIINAVAHKDYASGIPIQIRVYHDQLVIWNAGELPHDWTIERLTAKHASAHLQSGHCQRLFPGRLHGSVGAGYRSDP